MWLCLPTGNMAVSQLKRQPVRTRRTNEKLFTMLDDGDSMMATMTREKKHQMREYIKGPGFEGECTVEADEEETYKKEKKNRDVL